MWSREPGNISCPCTSQQHLQLLWPQRRWLYCWFPLPVAGPILHHLLCHAWIPFPNPDTQSKLPEDVPLWLVEDLELKWIKPRGPGET